MEKHKYFLALIIAVSLMIGLISIIMLEVLYENSTIKDSKNWENYLINSDFNTEEKTGIYFYNFTLMGETPQERRAYVFGFILGNLKDGYNKTTITITLNNITRVYDINNFPIESDCLNDNLCFVKYED